MKLAMRPHLHSLRRPAWALVLLVVVGSQWVACRKAAAPAKPILASVGEVAITPEDLLAEAARLQAAHHPVPDKETLLQDMVNHLALLQRAKAAGVDRELQVQREVGNLIIGRYLDRELQAKLVAVTVPTNEVREEYERQIAHFTQPAKARLALLRLDGGKKMSDTRRAELRARLEEARRRALAQPAPAPRPDVPGGFGALAIEFSDDTASRYRGGDIGWLEAGRNTYPWPRPVIEAGFALEKGVVSELIEAENSFFLVMKTDVRAAVRTPFEQVQSSIRQRLLTQKRHALDAAFRQQALRDTGTRIYREALAGLQLPPPVHALATNRESEPPPDPAGAGN